MKLKEQSFLVISILLVAIVLAVSIFYSTIILASYTELEEQYISRNIDQAVSKVNDELAAMALIAHDWGPWDDTVAFTHGQAPDYLHSNLQPYGFDNLRLNLIVITDTEGTVLFSGAYDIQNRTTIAVPPFFTTRIDPRHPLMNMSDPHAVTRGILMLEKGPVLVVATPVMYSNFTGSPHGVIIMGRDLNTEEVARLADVTRPTLSFTRADDPALPGGVRAALRQGDGPVPAAVRPLDGEKIAGYALIRDIYGNDALVLGITETRDIYHRGIATTEMVVIVILAAGLVMIFGILFLMDRSVLARIRSLAAQVDVIRKTPLSAARVEIAGDDELSDLAADINDMLGTIGETHESLMESQARFRELADLLPQVVWEVDCGGGLVYTNRIAFEYFRYTEEDFRKGVNVLSMIAPADLPRAAAAFRAMVAGDAIASPNEYLALRKDGSTFPISIYSSPIVADGKVTGLRGIIVDMTDRKKAEDSLRAANRQLSLLTGITRHDIINQLMILKGFLTLLEKRQSDPSAQEYLLKIRKGMDRISIMIQFTKEFESIGSHPPVWQDVRALVDGAKQQVQPAALLIDNTIPAGMEIFSDPLVSKVFFNLIDNAIRHGGKITTLRFGVQETGGDHLIVCEDDGDGIPEGEKRRIFERGVGKNTGLGLFLAREILAITGITIREAGKAGEGARFEMLVPGGNWRRKEP